MRYSCPFLLVLLTVVTSQYNVAGDHLRKLDAVRSSPAPTDVPSLFPSMSPSMQPSVSQEPSTSMEPTTPYEQCAGNLPFCWDGQHLGRGHWGYAKCFVIESDEHCGRYDFQIAGMNYSSSSPIDFSHCSSVWRWFIQCIAASFPSCHYKDTGSTFVHKTYTQFFVKSRSWKNPVEYYFAMGGSSESCYGDSCNSGYQYWTCADEDDAWAIYNFAKWVAGYRDDDRNAAESLFAEPDSQCATPAPSESLAPTQSPAPTFDIAPLCSQTKHPEYIPYENTTFSYNRFYMNNTWFSGTHYGVVATDGVCKYSNKEKFFDEPMPWVKDAGERVGGTLIVDQGIFTGRPMNASDIILDLESDPRTVTFKKSDALAGGDLVWKFDSFPNWWQNKNAATNFYNLFYKATTLFPLIWQTNLEEGLYCGSGTFCYDENPKVRCSVVQGNDNCGSFDFLIDDGVGQTWSTGDSFEWFLKCVETAYDCVRVESGTSFGYTTDPYVNRWQENKDDEVYHVVDMQNRGGTGDWRWHCPTELSASMWQNFYNAVRDAKLFAMEPVECTEAPSTSPTACTDSYFTRPPLNILLVVDTSYSTFETTFDTPVGDLNSDGKENTIMDAEIAAAMALLETIIETEELDNDNVNLGLVLFDTEARYIGNFKPTNSAGDGINADLMAALSSISIETNPNVVIDKNIGFTNMDDALDKAILYFEDETLPMYDSKATNLMVFLGDGKPNVRGDGDGEVFCTDMAACEGSPADILNDSDPTWEQGQLAFCFSGDTECDGSAYKGCVIGEPCLGNEQATNFDSELKRLDELGVVRLSIGVGDQSDVSVGSALWIIDNNDMKISHGLLPRQVLDAHDLINALADLCPENTRNPTDSPSASPTDSPSNFPTKAPTPVPSEWPSKGPSLSPTIDFCDYNTIDFEHLDDGETVPSDGSAMFPLEWEAYGLSIRAQPATLVNPGEDPSDPVPAHFHLVDSIEYQGMTLVIPQSDGSMNPDGGDIIITLDSTHDKGMEIHLWDVAGGGMLSMIDFEGGERGATFIKDLPDEMQIIQIAVTGVYQIYITFESVGALTQLNLCRDPLKTPAPFGLAPPSGSLDTREPTMLPSPPPSAIQTVDPTSAPTNRPSIVRQPTVFPTATPTIKEMTCPDDISLEVTTPENGTPFEFLPLTVLHHGTSTVTMKLTKTFSEKVSFVYIEYPFGHAEHCLGFESFETTDVQTFTAECMYSAPITLIQVYVSDQALVDGNAEIPQCCHHPDDIKIPVVKYTFKVHCVPQCMEE